jgi:hypothetical protein
MQTGFCARKSTDHRTSLSMHRTLRFDGAAQAGKKMYALNIATAQARYSRAHKSRKSVIHIATPVTIGSTSLTSTFAVCNCSNTNREKMDGGLAPEERS